MMLHRKPVTIATIKTYRSSLWDASRQEPKEREISKHLLEVSNV